MCQYGAALMLMLAAGLPDLSVLDDTIQIQHWYYCGPFSLGAREGVIGMSPDIEIDPHYTPDTTEEYVSMLTPGGTVRWQSIIPDHGKIEIVYEMIPWDTLQDYYGVAGISCGTYAYSDFYCAKRVRALVSAQGVSSFKLNGCNHPADPYKDGFFFVPVILDSGLNRVLLKLSGYTSHHFSFMIIPGKAPLYVVNDITKPDIIRKETSLLWLGIPLLNATDTWIRDIRIQIGSTFFNETIHHVPLIAPFCAMKVPVALNAHNTAEIADDSVEITLNITAYDISIDTSLWLYVKDGYEAHVRTFVSSIDNSCQYYAVLPPDDYQVNTDYALIMTCHGAGVRAENQVKAYTQKDWAFVVAPTNRRQYGFDWQDWGRLDFLEVLQDIKAHYRIDENRVYCSGHSMGGHGVWHIATMHPDLFAAIAPSAGWTSFQLYIPWFLQKSEIFAHPDLLAHRNVVLRDDNPLIHLQNLKDVPIYILQGGADDNVPPIQARMFAKYLDMLGCDYVYNEVPDKGHWWDFDSTPGVDCVNLDEMMDFLRKHIRQPQKEKRAIEPLTAGHTVKYAYYSPFILVYGTIGDSTSTSRNFQQARYQSFVWWYRANGFCTILPDTLITEAIMGKYNLILFGNPRTNSLVARINNKLPLHIEADHVVAGRKVVPGYDQCLIAVYPNPLHRERLVCLFSPTSHAAEKIIGAFNPLYSGSGLPDFIVYDCAVLKYGWAGVSAAGLFDRDWKLDPQNSYMGE
ncbi:prolyl oligopeptidase family serine peptidase [candidate division WOR-3 bacterium]|nr:prolyl oligopeptidase family serine peptidase [candidate division WOR-3 bacterium]